MGLNKPLLLVADKLVVSLMELDERKTLQHSFPLLGNRMETRQNLADVGETADLFSSGSKEFR